MNYMSIANMLGRMAGGAIPADKHMNSSEIWGVTLAGFGIVFAALILLVFIIFLFGKIFDAINQKKKDKEAANAATQAPKTTAVAKAAASAPTPKAAAPIADTSDEDEVIAAITAAIAMMSAADGKNYKIRSVKPAASNRLGGRTAWAMDGRRQNVMPF